VTTSPRVECDDLGSAGFVSGCGGARSGSGRAGTGQHETSVKRIAMIEKRLSLFSFDLLKKYIQQAICLIPKISAVKKKVKIG